jgi:hypothetical protein
MFISKILVMSILIYSVVGCGDSAAPKEEVKEEKKESVAAENTAPAPAPDANAEKAVVSFKVNGVQAKTTKGGGNDNESQLGMLTAMNNQLGLDLLGDDPARPHRGWLHFVINEFKMEPGSYTVAGGNMVQFTRYETANAGGSKDYVASKEPIDKGTEMTIQFTSVVKNEAAEFGEEWLVSGTFSSKMLVKEYSMAKRSSNEGLELTVGKFENVPVKILGKRK